MAAFRLRENIYKYLKYMEFIKSASPLTLRHYALDLRQAFQKDNSHTGLPEYPLALNEAELLAQARATFSAGWMKLSLASRNRKAATLKSFFGWAFQEELIANDLATHITCPKVPRKLPHFLSVDEVLAVMKSFQAQPWNEAANSQRSQSAAASSLNLLQAEVLFHLLYGGGLRVSEACHLPWAALQVAGRSLKIRGKGNKERLIVLPQLCVDKLSELQKISAVESPGLFVFGQSPMGTRKGYEIIRQSGIRAGLLKPLHPHALRHSFATHLLSSGANLRTLQEMLGHESLQATEKYTHLGIDHLARTMESLHPLGNRRKSG